MATPSSYQRVGATAADYDASAGPTFILFDGVDDSLASAAFAAGTLTSSMDCLIAVRRDNQLALVVSDGTDSNYFGYFEDWTETTALGVGASVSTWVDGVLVGNSTATAVQLRTALTIGVWHILEIRSADLSAWTQLRFSGYGGGYNLNGALGEIQLFASGQDANRDRARAQMAAYFGVTLP